MNDNEIWVFLSHSNKDYEKVRLVRNMLEDQALRPLMFFLHCLNDDDEIDSLIKREIDCRTRFILCDSENARKSHWVRKEVEYIKSQNRICETVDLSLSLEEISLQLQEFINKTRIFISYNREEFALAEQVYKRLILYDFSVYIDRLWDTTGNYNQDYEDTLKFLGSTVNQGYVISIMNSRILDPYSSSRLELIKAISENRSAGKTTPNIIPFVTHNCIIKAIQQDHELKPLAECAIQCLEDINKDERCDEIVKRVVTQLMTPGSIKVQADNFAKGIYGQPNEKEASFLYEILEKNY